MAEVRGSCDSRFEAVRAALAESLDGEDVGASAAVFVDGEPVADLWGGHTDRARTTAWERAGSHRAAGRAGAGLGAGHAGRVPLGHAGVRDR